MTSIIENLYARFYITFILDNRWQLFAEGLMMTILLTLSSFVLGTIVGAIVCLIRFSKYKTLVKVISVINGFFVQLPTLVCLMIMVYLIFGNSSLSVIVIVIIGLSLKSASYLSDIFYSAIAATNEGEAEAARALGMSRFQAFIYITLPQSVNNSISVYKNQFITTLQETSVVSSLAIQELTKASSIVTSRTLDAMFGLICISVLYLAVGYAGNAVIGLLGHTKHLGDEVK